jgi:hypothetical protein
MRISLHSPTHSAQMCTPGPATSRSPPPPGLPQNEHAPAAALPRLRRRCLPRLMEHSSSFLIAGMLIPRLARTRRARIQGQRAEQVLGPHVPAAAAPGQGLGPADSLTGLGGLRRQHLPGLPGAGKQLTGRGAHRIGPHAQLLQDRRRHALLEQPGQQVIGADLAGPVRGGFPPRRLQAGQQPVLRL